MGILPICDKSQWQTPTLLTSWRKIWTISSTNERPWNWSCDGFSANHRARFQESQNHKGYPLQNILGFFIGICHIWGVSPYWQILGFVIFGLFATLPEWKEDLPIYHSGRVANNFLIKLMTNPTWVLPIMGNVPILTKPTHIWQTPTLLTSWRKIQAISSTNERAQK